jgi:hypothetical protein
MLLGFEKFSFWIKFGLFFLSLIENYLLASLFKLSAISLLVELIVLASSLVAVA